MPSTLASPSPSPAHALHALTRPLRVHLGQAAPHNLLGVREVDTTAQVLQRVLAAPVTAAQWPDVVAMMFNLCGQAHRWCCRLALAATGASAAPEGTALAQALRHETVLEHLRRMALDWPRLLAAPHGDAVALSAQRAQAAQWVRGCPVWPPAVPSAQSWPAMRDWLAQHLLGVPAAAWWQAWQADPQGWMRTWTAQRATWLAALLADWVDLRDLLNQFDQSAHAAVSAGAQVLNTVPALALPHGAWPIAPSAHHIAQTGTWTRACDHLPTPLTDVLSLLGARVADLVALCLPDAGGCGASRLAHGATQAVDETGQVWGVAWVEMARGLLCHRVRVAPSADGAWRVVAAAMQAPTDWNMHPHGPVAQVLNELTAPPQVAWWMAAFDPCVPFECVPSDGASLVKEQDRA